MIFVIVVPYFGVFVYLIARGHKISEHAVEAAQAQDAAQRAYIESAVGAAPSTADELARLAELKANGTISDAESSRPRPRHSAARSSPRSNRPFH